MNINEKRLNEFIKAELIIEFDKLSDFLKEVNTERSTNWSDIYPKEFKSFKEAKILGVYYFFTFKGKYYWILSDTALNVYKD